MSDKRVTMGISLYPTQFRRLALIEKQTGMSKSEIIRRLIDSAYTQPAVVTTTEKLPTRAEPEPA